MKTGRILIIDLEKVILKRFSAEGVNVTDYPPLNVGIPVPDLSRLLSVRLIGSELYGFFEFTHPEGPAAKYRTLQLIHNGDSMPENLHRGIYLDTIIYERETSTHCIHIYDTGESKFPEK